MAIDQELLALAYISKKVGELPEYGCLFIKHAWKTVQSPSNQFIELITIIYQVVRQNNPKNKEDLLNLVAALRTKDFKSRKIAAVLSRNIT